MPSNKELVTFEKNHLNTKDTTYTKENQKEQVILDGLFFYDQNVY